jgi:NACHT domain
MPGIETAVAGVAAGPAKGFVDALVGPTINKVRNWSLEREVRAQLRPERLEQSLERYLRRTLTSAASIQSVVFPQHELPLLQSYEPLLLQPVAPRKGDRRFLLAADLLANLGHVTIIDQAGMGKTTYSKYLLTRVCERTDKIPILFNLRNYEAGEPLVKALLRELHELDKEFGQKLFERLLIAGKFFIILDGFDEVGSNWQSDVRLAIETFAVKCGGSRIVLTTRPQANVPILAGGFQYQFVKLNTQQAHSLIRRYDKFAGIEVGERLIAQLDLVPDELLQTPLLVALLYRTFGANNTVASKITAFYSDTFEALFRGHDLTKAGFHRRKECGLDFDTFRRALQLLAFHAVVKRKISWRSEEDLVEFMETVLQGQPRERTLARKIANDLLMAVPFLVRDGAEFRFIHRTFAEYFAAEFIARHPDSTPLLKKLRERDDWYRNEVVFNHINELSPALTRRVFTLPAANALLGMGVRGDLSIQGTLSTGFEWRILWGTVGEVGDAAKKLGTDSPWVSIDLVAQKRHVKLILSATPVKALSRMPPFSWEDVTMPGKPPTQQSYESEGVKRLALARALADYERGRVHRLSKEAVSTFLVGDVFLSLAIGFLPYVAGNALDERVFTESACAAVIACEANERAQLESLDDLLATANNDI